MSIVGIIPCAGLKKKVHYWVFLWSFQFLSGAISAVITYHNPENKPKRGICVANHTSPIDVLILACDNAYALVRIQIFFVKRRLSAKPWSRRVG